MFSCEYKIIRNDSNNKIPNLINTIDLQTQRFKKRSSTSMGLKIITLLIVMSVLGQVSTRVVYPEGLWPMNAFGQFTSENEQILAYYDFNRDRFVDILTSVQGPTYEIRIYLWSQQLRTFVNKGSLNLGMFKPDTAISADVVQDGTIDLLLTMELDTQDENDKLKTAIYCVDCTNMTCKIQNTANVQPFSTGTFPTVMQIQGENIIVYNDDGKLQSKVYRKGKFYEQQFVKEYFTEYTDDIISSVCADYLNIFYLDYNGDCYQDLIIHCNPSSGMADLQFYRGNQKGLFKPEYKAKVIDGLKLLNVAIVDINFDGLVDVVELVHTLTGQLYFEIHYNTAVKETLQICKITISTQTSQYFPFHFISSDAELSQPGGVLQIQRVSLPYNYQQWTLLSFKPQDYYIRAGDINSDGYMDLIVDGPNKAELLINQQCLSQSCGTYNPKFMEKWSLGKIRIFSRRLIDGMTNYDSKICEMSFLDIHEDGRLDLFANLCPLGSFDVQKTGKILAIYNSLPIDAFFIKITVLENLENDIMKSQTMDKKLNTFGAHADFYVTALNGQRIPACGNQLSHPGRSLELPYIHTGLGRTNNYVEQVSITISGKQSSILKTWSPIVPNSQLIIVPGPKWILQTYISPTSVMAILFWFVVLILALLAFWIARLTRRQKIEDKQNQDSFYAILR